MTQADLNRAVARATGESMSTIRELGFQLAEAVPDDSGDADGDELSCVDEIPADEHVDRGPRVIDWDDLTAVSLEELLAAA